jgi:hypothetical protein
MCQELHTPVLGFVLSGPVTARKTLGIVPSWVKFANHRFSHPYEKKQGRGGPAFLSGISRLVPLELLSLSGPSLPGSGDARPSPWLWWPFACEGSSFSGGVRSASFS